MELQNFGCIKSIALPSDWQADSELNTGVLKMLCARPKADSDIEITLFQKTQGVSAESMQIFRTALNQGEHKIVEGSDQLLKLSPIMGNAGNNQWTNKDRGRSGPNFRFTSGEVTKINGKPVLKVKGSFLEPESKKLQNEYCGIFIDAGTDNNLVQEIYLQVPSHYGYFQFEKYLKTFTDALFTLKWV
jgi:hypothetical protein